MVEVESSIWRQIGASVQVPPIQVKLFETLFKNTPAITAVASLPPLLPQARSNLLI